MSAERTKRNEGQFPKETLPTPEEYHKLTTEILVNYYQIDPDDPEIGRDYFRYLTQEIMPDWGIERKFFNYPELMSPLIGVMVEEGAREEVWQFDFIPREVKARLLRLLADPEKEGTFLSTYLESKRTSETEVWGIEIFDEIFGTLGTSDEIMSLLFVDEPGSENFTRWFAKEGEAALTIPLENLGVGYDLVSQELDSGRLRFIITQASCWDNPYENVIAVTKLPTTEDDTFLVVLPKELADGVSSPTGGYILSHEMTHVLHALLGGETGLNRTGMEIKTDLLATVPDLFSFKEASLVELIRWFDANFGLILMGEAFGHGSLGWLLQREEFIQGYLTGRHPEIDRALVHSEPELPIVGMMKSAYLWFWDTGCLGDLGGIAADQVLLDLLHFENIVRGKIPKEIGARIKTQVWEAKHRYVNPPRVRYDSRKQALVFRPYPDQMVFGPEKDFFKGSDGEIRSLRPDEMRAMLVLARQRKFPGKYQDEVKECLRLLEERLAPLF